MNRIIAFLTKLFFKDTASANIQTVLDKSSKVFILHFLAVILTFGGNVLIARWFGDEIYGLYSLLFSWLAVLAIFAQIGMDDYHLAVVPAMHLSEDYGSLRKILRISTAGIIIASVIVVVIFYSIINLLPIPGLHENAAVFSVGLWLIILHALNSNYSSFLRGYGTIVQSQLAEKVIRPLVFLLLIVPLANSFGPGSDIIYKLIVISAISLFISFCYLFFLTKKGLGHKPYSNPVSFEQLRFGRNGYFLLLTILYFLTTRLDILSVGLISEVKDVGYYNVAMKIAEIVGYPAIIINLVAPTFLARQHFRENKSETYKLIQNGARLTFAGCVILFILILFAGKWLLGLYGFNFRIAFLPLLILGISQLVTAFSGPAAIFFIVSGREKTATFCMFINVMVTALCCFIMIPAWGIAGAALASLTGTVVFNALIIISFYRFEKVLITPVKIFGRPNF
ncbi:lipopolysaccharide biosynthesis protein [Pollutibacter soli]|uniref:lipopolysaccharide biosynthesis protein n=1 Tax=Pollutibacter soli TaxID=3034157 RepID=UPI0030141870